MRHLLTATVGIFSVSFFPVLPPLALLLLMALCTLLTWYCRQYLLLCLLLGIEYGSLYGHYLLQQQLPQALDGETFIIQGVVSDLPQYHDRAVRFQLIINTIVPENRHQQAVKGLLDKKVSLSWYSKGFEQKHAAIKIVTGDVVKLVVKLRRPRGFVNPGGFDYQGFLLQKGIVATGYVKADSRNQLLHNVCHQQQADLLLNPHCLRHSLAEHFSAYLSSSEAIGPFLGLLIGDKRLISQQQWLLLRDTGTIHLLAISGLHIGLAAVIGFLFMKPFIFLWMRITNSNRGMVLAHLSSILFALTYSLLSGFSLPTQRACIMVILIHGFWLLRLNTQPWLFITIAVFVVAIIDPLAAYSSSFWLSFLAVVVLLYCFRAYAMDKRQQQFAGIQHYLLSLFKAQWVVTLGLLLPGLLLLGGASVASPVANSIAVPFISLVIVPLLLLSILSLPLSLPVLPPLSEWAAGIAIHGLEYLFYFLEWILKVLPGFWFFDRGPLGLWQWLPAVVGIVMMLAPRGVPRHYFIGCLCLLPLAFPSRSNTPLELTFLEVGQGTAIVVKTPEHSLVYDVGRRFSQRFDSGEHIVAPYLLRSGRSSINYLMLSHGDSDHVGGKAGLLAKIQVDKILSGQPDRVAGEQCQAGQQWQWEQVSFTVLWPTQAYLQSAGINSNNYSCVLLLDYQGYRFLLPGDIDGIVEAQLLAVLPRNIDVLLVPHHGSRSSSHSDWVDHLRPRHAVFTAGFYNPYGHPHPTVVERYQQRGAIVHHTGRQGAVSFRVTPDQKLVVSRERQNNRRYWYDNETTDSTLALVD